MRTVILMALFITSFALASGQTPNPSVEQQLREMERLKDEAHVKGDKDAFDRIYANDYVGINAAGGTSTKQDLIKFNTGFSQVMFESHTSNVMAVRAFTDIALVTGTYTFKYKKPARGDDSGEYRCTTVYALRSGKWQIVAEQFTRVKK